MVYIEKYIPIRLSGFFFINFQEHFKSIHSFQTVLRLFLIIIFFIFFCRLCIGFYKPRVSMDPSSFFVRSFKYKCESRKISHVAYVQFASPQRFFFITSRTTLNGLSYLIFFFLLTCIYH